MNIVVLNGSPKGDMSVTLQYIRYAGRKLPAHNFKVFNVAKDIKRIEKDIKAFNEIVDAVKNADAVLWSFPLYFLVVCSQYKRFIELIFERKQQKAFAGKYTASISTSVHFFDHTAHNYIHAVCDDLNMVYVGAYSPGMYDLMKQTERDRLLAFFGQFIGAVERNAVMPQVYRPLTESKFKYKPGRTTADIDTSGRSLLIIHDVQQPSGNTAAMVQSFAGNFSGPVDLVSLDDINIAGGCLGCCRCGIDNICDYEGKDGYIDFYRTKVARTDILVFAGAVHDRYLSSTWKMFFDRSFFNTHIPVLKNKQVLFLVSGPVSEIPNLREIFAGYTETQEGNLAGIISDESADSRTLDRLLREAAINTISLAEKNYRSPVTFLGTGGRKIFRDEVYGMLRFVFQADHRYYKRNGYYDFPQRDFKTRRMNFIMMLLTKIPAFKKKFRKILKSEMVKPVKHAADNK